MKKVLSKKLKGNMVVMIIIFMLTFLVFCICAIDAGHTVTARYKVQKITETLVLYMTSYLNSKPAEERTEAVLEPLKERFESLYSGTLSGYYNFKITDIKLKNETVEPRLKITVEANIPTIFLKYAGIGVIKIMQVSYAKAQTSDMTLIDSDTNSYTFESDDIITDKNGDDINVKHEGDYFIFAGIKGHDGEIFWSDLSYAADVKKEITLTLEGDEAYSLGCVGKDKDGRGFDFSKSDDKTIGFIKYVKIYKADCSDDLTPPEDVPDSGIKGGEETFAAPEVRVLNLVKLIKRSEF